MFLQGIFGAKFLEPMGRAWSGAYAGCMISIYANLCNFSDAMTSNPKSQSYCSLTSIHSSGMIMILASSMTGQVRCNGNIKADMPRKNFTKFARKVLQDLRAAKKAEASARQDWFLWISVHVLLQVCRWCYSVNMAFFKDLKWLAWLYILLDMLYLQNVRIIILKLWRVVEELFKFYGKDTPPFNDSFVSFFGCHRLGCLLVFFQNRNSSQII